MASTALERVRRLVDDPRPRQSKKLRGPLPGWRLRFGDYRIVYTISDREALVLILRIGHRGGDVYGG